MAKLYDNAYLETLQAYFAKTKQRSYELLDPKPGITIADIGCGNGEDAIILGRSGANVIGIDNDPPYIDIANAKDKPGNVRFVCSEAHDLPLDAESVDKARFERVFQHIADHGAVLNEMHRILKPGGELLIIDSDFLSISFFCEDTGLERKIVDHITYTLVPNAYKVRHLPGAMAAAGFSVAATEVINYVIDGYGFANYIIMLDKVVAELHEQGKISGSQRDTWDRHKSTGHFKMSFNSILFSGVKG